MPHGALARAVMNNDKELAKVLIERLIGGADYLAIREGKVTLIDPIAFARDAEHTKRVVCARRAEERENDPRSAKRGKARGTTVLIKLNSNLDKRLALKSIISENGVIVSGDDAELLLPNFWTHTFTTVKEGMTRKIKEYLERWTLPLDFRSCVHPDCPLVARILRRLSDSGTGPDGIPYSAWVAAGADGVKTLLEFILFLMEGSSLPSWFGEMLQIAIPKGDECDALGHAYRKPSDTRPLALKKKNNKIPCATIAWIVREVLSEGLPKVQQ
jgi:hypothetical protein